MFKYALRIYRLNYSKVLPFYTAGQLFSRVHRVSDAELILDVLVDFFFLVAAVDVNIIIFTFSPQCVRLNSAEKSDFPSTPLPPLQMKVKSPYIYLL